jgi:hypothetical protein
LHSARAATATAIGPATAATSDDQIVNEYQAGN